MVNGKGKGKGKEDDKILVPGDEFVKDGVKRVRREGISSIERAIDCA